MAYVLKAQVDKANLYTYSLQIIMYIFLADNNVYITCK